MNNPESLDLFALFVFSVSLISYICEILLFQPSSIILFLSNPTKDPAIKDNRLLSLHFYTRTNQEIRVYSFPIAVLSYPIQFLFNYFLSFPILSYALSYPILSYPFLSCPFLSYPLVFILSYPFLFTPSFVIPSFAIRTVLVHSFGVPFESVFSIPFYP